MKFIRLPNRHTGCFHDRHGILAVNEVVVIVAVLSGLLWGTSQIVNVSPDASAATAAMFKASTVRAVYKITLNRTGDKIWIYRPWHGVDRLDLATGTIDQSLPLMAMELTCVNHSDDGTTTVVCGMDGTVLLFRDGQEPTPLRNASREMHGDQILYSEVSQDGRAVVCKTARDQIFGRISDHQTREFWYDLPSEPAILGIHLSRDGRQLSVGRRDGTVAILDPETGTSIRPTFHVGEDCTAFGWNRNGTILGVVGCSGRVATYDLQTGRVVSEGVAAIPESQMAMPVIEISLDGRRIALASPVFHGIRVWDVATGHPPRVLSGHDGIVRTIQFDQTSDRIYSGSYDGTVREWSLETGTQLRIID